MKGIKKDLSKLFEVAKYTADQYYKEDINDPIEDFDDDSEEEEEEEKEIKKQKVNVEDNGDDYEPKKLEDKKYDKRIKEMEDENDRVYKEIVNETTMMHETHLKQVKIQIGVIEKEKNKLDTMKKDFTDKLNLQVVQNDVIEKEKKKLELLKKDFEVKFNQIRSDSLKKMEEVKEKIVLLEEQMKKEKKERKEIEEMKERKEMEEMKENEENKD